MSLLSRIRTFRRRFRNPKVFSKTAGMVKKHMSSKKQQTRNEQHQQYEHDSVQGSLPCAISLPPPQNDASTSDLYANGHFADANSFEEYAAPSDQSYLTEPSFTSHTHSNKSSGSASPIPLANRSKHGESLLLATSAIAYEENEELEEKQSESFDVTQPFMSEQDESIVFQSRNNAIDAAAAQVMEEEPVLTAIEEEENSAVSTISALSEVSVSVIADEQVVLASPPPVPSSEQDVVAQAASFCNNDSLLLNTTANNGTTSRSSFLRSNKMSALRVVLNNPKHHHRGSTSPKRSSRTFKRLSSSFKLSSISGGLSDEALQAGLKEICAKPFKDQAVRFLNAFWHTVDNPEQVWDIARKFSDLCVDRELGVELDELKAHRVFELLGQAMTITEMRTKLKSAAAGTPVHARHVALSEFLLLFYGAEWRLLVSAPQTSAEQLEQMEEAEKLMKCSSDALAQSQEKAKLSAKNHFEAGETAALALQSKTEALSMEEQVRVRELAAAEAEAEATKLTSQAKQAFETCAEKAEQAKQSEQATYEHLKLSAALELEAKRGEELAQQAEAKALAQENQAREAESEAFRKEKLAQESELLAIEAEKALVEATERVAEALNKVKAEEAQFANKLEELRVQSEDMNKGLVARRKAKHELEVLLANNPDHLQQARIGEEAIVRKHEKLIKAASVARQTSAVNRAEAEKLKLLAIDFRATCEKQASEAQVRRSASETKAMAAAEARAVCEQAQQTANEELMVAEEWKRNADEALLAAQNAQAAAREALRESVAATQEATASRERAEQQEAEAVQAAKLAEESREQAEAAVLEAIAALENAQHFVDRVKQLASSGQGGWWWASRELEEAKRFVPQKKMHKLVL